MRNRTHNLPEDDSRFGASGDEEAVRATPQARRSLKQFRTSTYRFRHQMPPWRMLWLIPVALGAHTVLWPPMWAKLLIVFLAGGLLGWRVQQTLGHGHQRLYANVCVTTTMLWLVFAVRCGLWGQPGKYSTLLFLLAWLPLSFVWWDRHRIRATAETPDLSDWFEIDPFLREWETKVYPVMEWELADPYPIAAGTAYELHLVPGQTLEDAEQARRKVASLLGGIARDRLVFEAGDNEDEATIRLMVLNRDNPQSDTQTWPGPTLDKSTGLYRHGVYPDGAAFLRLFTVEDGIPHRGTNGLWCGATGKGKSRGVAIKIAEHLTSGMFVVWYADGQAGASAPELDGRVDWYADSPEECVRMLRAAWKVMKVRGKAIKRMYQEAFNGRKAILLGSAAFPFLQIILDEAQEFLTDKVVARLVKGLLRMGNKVAMGLDLITQVPLLSELGAASGDTGVEVIRGMAKAGNVAIYKTEDSFTGRVALGDGMEFDPKSLPNLPGACRINDGQQRAAWCRTYFVSMKALWEWSADSPVLGLEDTSARAAGEDYLTRGQRAADNDVAAEDIDLDDLDLELAILLGERLPGQTAPGAAAQTLTVKQAIFEIVKTNGGPIKRDSVDLALAARGMTPSKSTIDQALAWWVDRQHLYRPTQGHYDLLNREEQELSPTS